MYMLIKEMQEHLDKVKGAIEKIDTSTKEAKLLLKRFADSIPPEIKENKYKGEIAGEIEHPGEMI